MGEKAGTIINQAYTVGIKRAALACVLCLGAVALIAVSVYPPWIMTVHRQDHPLVSVPAGYDWLSSSPEIRPGERLTPYGAARVGIGFQVDYGRLLIEWVVVAAGAGVAVGVAVLWSFRRYSAQRAAWLKEWRARASEK
jgi:hypothetical protein